MSHIYGCPVELLQSIFTDACFDDPPTACALRLVDRRISAACASLRFSTVSASGEKQLQALLYALDTANPSDVRIQRLFVCDRVRAEADEDFDLRSSGCVYDSEDEDHNVEVKQRNCGTAARLEGTIGGILRHAAPHVQSLCFLSFNPEFVGMLDRFAGVNFPLLTSLALRCVPEVRVGRRDWCNTMPVLRTLTCRFSDYLEYTTTAEGYTGSLARRGGELTELISSLLREGELTELIVADYEPGPETNAFICSLLTGGSERQRGRPERLEIHPISRFIEHFGEFCINWEALADLRSMRTNGSREMIVYEVETETSSYETWKQRWRTQQ